MKFWGDHFHPDDGFTPTTVTALVDNGSAPALGLLEKELAQALRMFQAKNGLDVTGEIDQATKDALAKLHDGKG